MVNQAIHMVLLNPFCLALIFIGVVIGIIFGSIPGLSASMALILFLPMSFGMEPMNGIALLVGLYLGGISGGLISAVPHLPSPPCLTAAPWRTRERPTRPWASVF